MGAFYSPWLVSAVERVAGRAWFPEWRSEPVDGLIAGSADSGVMGDDDTLGDIAEERPREVLTAIERRLGDEALTRDRLISLVANVAREEGLNLPRLVNRHPEAVEELWGQQIEFDEYAVEMVDDALEGRLG